MLPELTLARVAPRQQRSLVEHRVLHKPTDIGVAGGFFRIRGRRRRRSSRHRWAGGGPGRSAGRPESPENGDQEQKNAPEPVRLHDVAQSYSFSSPKCSASTSAAEQTEEASAPA